MKSKELHEENKYEDDLFPVGLYTVSANNISPKGRGYKDLHWHEELQFTFLKSGVMTIQVFDKTYTLNEGDAIFINRGLLHMTTKLSADAEYISVNFPEKILSFFTGSRMEQECVLPFTMHSGLTAYCFASDVLWEAEVRNLICEVIDKYTGLSYDMKNFDISILLVSLWSKMINNIKNYIKPMVASDLKKHKRLQHFIAFIHGHYADDISIGDIAQSAHVSVGECGRSFKRVLNVTPYEYLLNYRVIQSMQFLNDSDASISDIARLVGFNSVSHYIQQFKKRVGKTPNAFRRGV